MKCVSVVDIVNGGKKRKWSEEREALVLYGGACGGD